MDVAAHWVGMIDKNETEIYGITWQLWMAALKWRQEQRESNRKCHQWSVDPKRSATRQPLDNVLLSNFHRCIDVVQTIDDQRLYWYFTVMNNNNTFDDNFSSFAYSLRDDVRSRLFVVLALSLSHTNTLIYWLSHIFSFTLSPSSRFSSLCVSLILFTGLCWLQLTGSFCHVVKLFLSFDSNERTNNRNPSTAKHKLFFCSAWKCMCCACIVHSSTSTVQYN